MWLLTAREMQAVDRETIDSGQVAALALMEHAGAAVARETLLLVAPHPNPRVEIVCGKGHNGGDGLVAARHLVAAGARVRVHLTHAVADLAPDARVCAARLEGTGVPLRVRGEPNDTEMAAALRDADACIDAVLGTGTTGTPRDAAAAAIEALVQAARPTVSVDIPSGVDADSGAVRGVAVQAHVTVTFGAAKVGHAFDPGRAHRGRLVVADIGFSADVLARHARGRTWVDRDLARRWLPPLEPTAHKYTRGCVVVVAGSRRYTGAAALAATAALRTGAGIVHLVTPASVRAVLQQKLTEVIVHGVAETAAGTIAAAAAAEIIALLPRARALVIGPGLDADSEVDACSAAVLEAAMIPAVVDADALAALPAVAATEARAVRVATPHAGELRRWIGAPVPAAPLERIAQALSVAAARGIVLLAKGAPTLVASADGRAFVNSTGHAGLATAGSGDVLAGVVGALLAQGIQDPAQAAALGAWVHGRAAELACQGRSRRSLIASDLLPALGVALAEIEALNLPE